MRYTSTAGLDVTELDTACPFMPALPQSRTERILNEGLEGLGGKMEHETAFTGFGPGVDGVRPNADSVCCRIDGPSGEDNVVATHLIGADGARSRVGEQAGIDFPGDSLDHDWTIADVVLD